MEAWKACLLVFGLILVVAVQSGLSINCYVCNSGSKYHGKHCSDRSKLMEANLLVDCAVEEVNDRLPNGTYTLCRIFRQHVQGETRMIRQCASGGSVDRCIERTGTKGVKLEYCHCDQDGCNSAATIYTPITMVTAVVMAIWLTVQRT